MYSFKNAIKQWGNPPAEGRGYISSESILNMQIKELKIWVNENSNKRYNSWRGAYAQDLHLDKKAGIILDYGCGFGTDSLRLAKAGNKIILADINESNLAAAKKIHAAFGFKSETCIINPTEPFINPPINCDVFFSSGVLHHFPYADKVLEWASLYFNKAILLVYSDILWEMKTKTPMIRVNENVEDHLKHEVFVKAVDGVGEYAEPYNEERILSKLLQDNWILNELITVGNKGQFYAIHATSNKKEK